MEQGVPETLEHDDDDFTALHAVLVNNDRALATGRLVFVDEATAKIGRLAVKRSHRGRGLGRRVLAALSEAAQQRGATRVKLHAQCSAQAFYEMEGFAVAGEPFEEAGIAHVLMIKTIESSSDRVVC